MKEPQQESIETKHQRQQGESPSTWQFFKGLRLHEESRDFCAMWERRALAAEAELVTARHDIRRMDVLDSMGCAFGHTGYRQFERYSTKKGDETGGKCAREIVDELD